MTEPATYIAELGRLYVLLTLVAAAAGKAAAPAAFRDTVAELFRLPRWAGVGAAAIICAEALAALALAAGGDWARAGMAAAAILFIAFSGVILVALVQGRVIACNCFGGRDHAISAWDLVRNGALVAASGFYLRTGAAGHGLDPAAWALLAGVALILFLVSTNLDDIARLAR